MAGEPIWRISQQDLDKLMTTLDVTFVRLSECALAAGAHLAVARTDASTIHCCLRGAGFILVDNEIPIPCGILVGVNVRDRKLAQVVVIACRRPAADVIVRADVGAEAQRPPDRTHVHSRINWARSSFTEVSLERDGALKGVAATIPAMVMMK